MAAIPPSFKFKAPNNYFDLDDILASQEKVPCTFLNDVTAMGKPDLISICVVCILYISCILEDLTNNSFFSFVEKHFLICVDFITTCLFFWHYSCSLTFLYFGLYSSNENLPIKKRVNYGRIQLSLQILKSKILTLIVYSNYWVSIDFLA